MFNGLLSNSFGYLVGNDVITAVTISCTFITVMNMYLSFDPTALIMFVRLKG